MAWTAWLVCLIALLVATAKHSEKQVLVAGTKQSDQAERAVRAA
jgi:hypothetical protein